jgi:hypothetical protein
LRGDNCLTLRGLGLSTGSIICSSARWSI